MSVDLPFFRYRPDPLASGSIRASAEPCACCGRSTGWICTATFYSAQEVSGRFCPWCIADGSAADRFAGEFTDSYGLDGVSDDVFYEVTRRTPWVPRLAGSALARPLPRRGRLRGRSRVHGVGGAP
ncbi:CbrC family protein [Streptomyces sp. E5N91]|uniref:CbrC family protein n=1 Tax=Streptomyces sp. E5N91 TaxID=1851996 RepID=UPI001EE8BC93|nr:CbrC family protein [Streptomyces sp. E5N91]